jgi:carbon-monoxide dehydrogenase small subunit
MIPITLTVNGAEVRAEVEDRTLLSDFLRDHLRLTGSHVGCDTVQCGACVVHLDGRAVKSCNVLAAQASGRAVRTIEGLAAAELHPVQRAFSTHHALQCGFCTPGMIMSVVDLLRRHPTPDEALVREQLSGNLCRCTGYENIVNAVLAVAASERY